MTDLIHRLFRHQMAHICSSVLLINHIITRDQGLVRYVPNNVSMYFIYLNMHLQIINTQKSAASIACRWLFYIWTGIICVASNALSISRLAWTWKIQGKIYNLFSVQNRFFFCSFFSPTRAVASRFVVPACSGAVLGSGVYPPQPPPPPWRPTTKNTRKSQPMRDHQQRRAAWKLHERLRLRGSRRNRWIKDD